MESLDNLPYILGLRFKENSIDLEFRKKLNDGTDFYSSNRYNELYLFGKSFESICYLYFGNGILKQVEYKFQIKYFELFYDAISNELPRGKKLLKDPFVKEDSYLVFLENYNFGIEYLNANYFLFKYWK